MLAHFHLLVKELGALLAELFSVAMLELADLAIGWRYVSHDCCTSTINLSASEMSCL
jgi:hypothetical protein